MLTRTAARIATGLLVAFVAFMTVAAWATMVACVMVGQPLMAVVPAIGWVMITCGAAGIGHAIQDHTEDEFHEQLRKRGWID